jgi:hypothetical protein
MDIPNSVSNSAPSGATLADDPSSSQPMKKIKVDRVAKLHSSCAQFCQESWKLVDNVKIKQDLLLSLLNRGNPGDSAVSILLQFLTVAIWQVLVDCVNKNLAEGMTAEYPGRGSSRPTDVEEMIHFYAIVILMESTFGNQYRNLRDHFAFIKLQYGAVKRLGCSRFKRLRCAFNPSIEDIKRVCDLLRGAFHSHISEIHSVTVDESLIGYQPSRPVKDKAEKQGEPIPVAYIPRKPHPNGLLGYLLLTPVDHPGKPRKGLPYILDILPHVSIGDSAPQDVVRKFMERWTWAEKPHIVSDAAFGSATLLDDIEKWGGTGTFSMSTVSLSHIWEVLSANLQSNTWRAAANNKNWITSCTCLIEPKANKWVHQQILTNAFTSDVPQPMDTVSDNSGSPADMPAFTEDALKLMKVDELANICRKWQIPPGKTKVARIANILARSAIIHQQRNQLEELERYIKTKFSVAPGPPHAYYLSQFNLIDLANRKWNAVEEHHQNHHWKSKMILMILRFAVLNSWVYATKISLTKWKQWRFALAQEMLKYHSP